MKKIAIALSLFLILVSCSKSTNPVNGKAKGVRVDKVETISIDNDRQLKIYDVSFYGCKNVTLRTSGVSKGDVEDKGFLPIIHDKEKGFDNRKAVIYVFTDLSSKDKFKLAVSTKRLTADGNGSGSSSNSLEVPNDKKFTMTASGSAGKSPEVHQKLNLFSMIRMPSVPYSSSGSQEDEINNVKKLGFSAFFARIECELE